MNTKRNRGGRPNPGRPDKRQIYQDRPRPRGPPIDKNAYIEGVYKNQRFTNIVFSLVGTTVQAQVKNGLVYEGILKTVSNKGDAVLEMAHMVEDNSGTSSPGLAAPSRERIMDKLIIKVADLITINAANVDLEYAVKDAFTDTGISKYNGETKDKEMRELQPWDSEGADEIGCLEGDKSNGWDVHDMFQTNAVNYNYKSTYDESLGQYTTKLNKENSEEYRRREEEATRLAAEIERSEQYKKHIALENGEGDDEEAAFSSVVRPGESQNSTGSGGPGKYIPPNKRSSGSGNMGKSGGRGYAHPHQQNVPPIQHHHGPAHGPPIGRGMGGHRQSPPVPSHTTNSQSSAAVPVSINGEKSNRPSIPASTAGPTIKTSSPVHEGSGPPSEVKHEHSQQQYPSANKTDTKKSLKGRDEQIKELKEFSSNFKLDDNKETKDKDKEKSGVENRETVNKETVHEDKAKEAAIEKSSDYVSAPEKSAKPVEEKKTETEPEKSAEAESKPKDITINSKLNPNANIFTPKSFPQKQPSQQIPTPPRPHTQSPIIQPTQMMAQPVYPGPGQSFIMPPTTAMVPTAQPAPQQLQYRPKRAVVSVKPDYTASAVQAATGQPLLAQSAQPYMYFHQVMNPQPTGYQMGQMLPMPAAQTNPRFMTPTSMQGMPPTTMQGAGMDQNNPSSGQGAQMYMTQHQQGPMPAHMNPASHLNHPNMNHLSMSSNTGPSSQMNPAQPSGAGPHHPAPSPVLTNHNQQPMGSGPHPPPTSGTPQPPQGYPQAANLQAPPLQPSPHNPTSPQNMQPMPYHYNTSLPLQMQNTAGGQFSLPQQSSGQSSVTYSMHSHQSPHMQPPLVMMHPQMSASGQLNHPHHIHGQFQGHPMAGPGSMQQQLMSQSGVQGLHTQTPGQGPHPQHQMQHFLPQVHNAGGQAVQNYQPSQ